MTDPNSEKLLKTTTSDLLYALSKGSISLIPVAGGVLSELVSLLVTSPATKRRDRWVEQQLAEAFKLIGQKADYSLIKDLHENDLFLTIVLQATLIAGRTHQKEKLEALKNAVVNSVLTNAPEESLQLMFLNFVDTFTPYHLTMLDFVDKPIDWCRKNRINVDNRMLNYVRKNSEYSQDTELKNKEQKYFLEKIFPGIGEVFPGTRKIEKKAYLYNQALIDLENNGLLKDRGGIMLGRGYIFNLDLHSSVFSLSDTGQEFLSFIELPSA
ncbi:MAG: hypothetical protein M3O33_05535 [Cyanobacteriota bacterium]|nr:hypothetical protein [Cyanobacteriota bacterium]